MRNSQRILALVLALIALPIFSLSAEEAPTESIASAEVPADMIGDVRLNELMTGASPYYNTQGYDWVELYNAGGKAVNLKGWRLVLNDEKEYIFSNGNLGKGKYLRVYCTEEKVTKNKNTGFPLPAKKGTLCLYNAKDELIARVSWKKQPGNIALGLTGTDGTEYVLLESDTPGAKNVTEGYPVRSAEPVILPIGGSCSEPVEVTISAPGGATVRYTLDGSVPTRKSPVYTGPFTVNENTVIRAVTEEDGKLLSACAAASYLFGVPEGVRLVSVLSDPDHLYSNASGILVSGSGSVKNYKQDWECPANVEYFDQQGKCLINQVCGMKVAGAISRNHSQKALALYARKSYGEETFPFNPFPLRDYSELKCFVLRAGGSEGTVDGLRFRDALLCDLAQETSCLASQGVPVLVYLNGKMYGHCNLREKTNKHFVAALENVPEDQVDNIDILTQDGSVSNGSNKDYKSLSAFCKKNDLNDPENLQYVLDRLDTDTLFDCLAYAFITGNADMHNMKFYRVPGGKWKWMIYDLDTALRGMNAQPAVDASRGLKKKPETRWDPVPFAALMKVPEMRADFFTRMGKILNNTFTEEKLNAAFEKWHDEMAPIMAVHSTRWTSMSMDRWEQNIQTKRACALDRRALVIDVMKKYFNLTEQEEELYFR